MRSTKLRLSLLVFCLFSLLCLGATKGFTCTGGDCSLSAHAQKYWQAAPEYPSAWKGKMRLLGYLGRGVSY